MKPWTKRKLDALEEAGKAAELKNFVRRKTNTTQQIDDLIKYVLPIKLGTKRICNHEDHCSPYDFFVDILTNYYQTIIVWANRGGSKTYLITLYSWLKSIRTPGLVSRILGASKEQSTNAYSAMDDFWAIGNSDAETMPLISSFCKKQPLTQKTIYKNGAETKILAASDKAVRGPHPQESIFDEVAAMDRKIFETALSGPQSKNDIKMQKVLASTNHVVGSLLDEQIELSKKNPEAKRFKWCIWECLESCKGYSCSTCEISSYCPGEQMKGASGYYQLPDFLDKLRSLSKFTVENEWFNTKPGNPDMVYGNELKESHFINIDFDPSRRVYLVGDWGGDHPFCFQAWQDFRGTALDAWAMVDEIYEGKTDNPHIMNIVKGKPWVKNIAMLICDPSRYDLKLQWKRNFPSIDDKNKELKVINANNAIAEGVEKCRGALKPLIGKPKVYFSNKCEWFRKEIYNYETNQKTGLPVDDFDHSMDAFRYIVATLINPIMPKDGKSKSEAIQSKGGNYDRRNRR